ncbi:hypothetical protein A2U01_0103753, partial [Trifolium medium]|nr:hypothetical protein [Trifolium medium]
PSRASEPISTSEAARFRGYIASEAKTLQRLYSFRVFKHQ